MRKSFPRLTWITDTKINFQAYQDPKAIDLKYRQFIQFTVRTNPAAVLLQSETAQIPGLAGCASKLQTDLHGCPLYFVAGNPGYHHSSVADFQSTIAQRCAGKPGLHYLGAAEEPIALSDSVALIGHDGWADSRYDGRSPAEALAAINDSEVSFDGDPLQAIFAKWYS
jgi:hypothetical protein